MNAKTNIDMENLGFDPDALREKYNQERDKRIVPVGNKQYQQVTGDFAPLAEDPFVKGDLIREPLTDTVEAAIIGGGFGGLLAAIRMKEAGLEKVKVIDKAADFGGTWYWNRYPGAQCDIESYLYLPLLEELGYMPSQKYAYGPEIFEHAKRMARSYDLYKDASLQTEVTGLKWSEEESCWIISTNREDVIKAKYVAISPGPFSRPKLPAIPGIADFKGHMFHTSRWDYDYTEGNENGGLNGLREKRVAIIGTGSTAVQCIPHLAKSAQQLYVFQRTPSGVDERGNSHTDPEWYNSLEPGWQKRRHENFNQVLTGEAQEDLVNDGWTSIFQEVQSITGSKERIAELDAGGNEEAALLAEIADFMNMNKVRDRVDKIVEDKETGEKLKPWYRKFCKRPCFHDDYLPTFNKPNVKLVDTGGHGVDKVTEKGLVVDGIEYEVDCIILSTGFEVGTPYTQRLGYDIIGRDNISLSEYWKDGMRTLHGFFSRGFPNLFHLGAMQNGISPNFTSMIDEQSRHIGYIIKEAEARGVTSLEPSERAEREWVELILEYAHMNYEFFEQCTPGFYNNEGKPRSGGLVHQQFAPGVNAFNAVLADWRDEGELAGLDLS